MKEGFRTKKRFRSTLAWLKELLPTFSKEEEKAWEASKSVQVQDTWRLHATGLSMAEVKRQVLQYLLLQPQLLPRKPPQINVETGMQKEGQAAFTITLRYQAIRRIEPMDGAERVGEG